jgi:hypothetical protein
MRTGSGFATVALLSFAWSIYQHRQLTRGKLHVSANYGYLAKRVPIG